MSANQVRFKSEAQKRSLGISVNLGVFKRKKKSPWEFLIHLWNTTGDLCTYTPLPTAGAHARGVGPPHQPQHRHDYTRAVWV